MLRTTRTLFVLALCALAAPALSLPLAREDEPKKEEGEAAASEKKDEEEEEEEEKWFALVGGDVHTGTGAVLHGATVVAKNGVIEEIGWDPWLPEGTEQLDVTGLQVYPGLIAMEASASIVQAPGGAVEEPGEPDDQHPGDSHLEPGDEQIAPHDDHEVDFAQIARDVLLAATGEPRATMEDAFDPFGQGLVLTLSSGITTVFTSDAVIKLKRRELDGVVLREGPLETFAWSSKNPAGKRTLREKFAKTAEYLATYREWEAKKKSEEEKPPSDKDVDKKVLSVLKGEIRAKFPVNDRGDLSSLARFAQEFDFRPVIVGCLEGWTVADELGRAGALAIVTPRDRRSKDEELVRAGGSTIENAAILHRHGVQVAVITANTGIDLGGIMGHDLLALPLEAGFAVRGGLSEDAALAALTSVPARALGVSQRIGTLEKGKDCDLFVTDGDWLHYESLVQYTVVEGAVVYDKEKEIFFAHIRPRPKPEPAAEEPVSEEPPAAETEEPKSEEPPADDTTEEVGEEKDEEKKEEEKEEKEEEGGKEGDEKEGEQGRRGAAGSRKAL